MVCEASLGQRPPPGFSGRGVCGVREGPARASGDAPVCYLRLVLLALLVV
jgi:hypothetical protein